MSNWPQKWIQGNNDAFRTMILHENSYMQNGAVHSGTSEA